MGLEALTVEHTPDEPARSIARLQLANTAGGLMPGGVVAFAELNQFPLIKHMAQGIGKTEVQTLLVMLITNFCRSFNVVRNMNEDQVTECAMYLFDECKDFTLEDYVIMFALGKRGKIGEVLDHIDINVIASMHQQYLRQRMAAFKKIQEADSKARYEAKVAGLGPKDEDAGNKAMAAMKKFAEDFANKEKLMEQARLKENGVARHNKIMELIERDAMAGYAPAPQLIAYYFQHIKNQPKQ